MKSSLLIPLSFLAVAFAAPSGLPTLKASVSVANGITASRDLVVSATVTNTGNEDLRVLKYNTLLDNNPTRNFRLFKDGKEVGFQGIRLTPDVNDNGVYTVIPAGGSVTIEHDLSGRFNFDDAGTGKLTIKAANLIQFGRGTAIANEVTTVEVNDLMVDLDTVENIFTVQLTTPSCSDSSRLSVLQASLAEARALAGGAAADTRTHPNSAAINTYFGANNRDTIWWNLDRIAGDLSTAGTRTLYCQDPTTFCASNPGVVAYTSLVTSGDTILKSDIYPCDSFFSTPATSTICQGNVFTRGYVILHELSHAVFHALDTVYGCSGAAALSDAAKIQNAENYACFGTQIHRDYNC